jgi:Na+-translocating ferredoxin:NAD+ oxidoreductase RnfD subunit
MTTAISLRKRMAWTALALAPALLATLALHPGRATGLLLALAVGLAIESVALRLRALPLSRLRDDPGVAVVVAVTWLWLGSAADVPVLCILAAGVAGLMRAAFGGTGQSPFHPAAVALAAILVLAAPQPAGAASIWPALGVALGIALMLARRLLAWPTLLGWFAGVLAGALMAGVAMARFDLLALALVAGFVLDDGGSAGIRPGPRFAVALAAGVLASTLPGPAALAAAVVLANFLAPAIESAWPSLRSA